jgi:DNA-binding transcriptional regulator YhcF (GntR family)
MFPWRKRRMNHAAGDPGFTDDVRRILARAVQEANELRHEYVGPEHMLLALVSSGHPIATRMLAAAGAQPAAVGDRLLKVVLPGKAAAKKRMSLPYTARARTALELAINEAHAGGGAVGAEHLLLGIAGEDQGIASQVLRELGATVGSLRAAVPDPPPTRAPAQLAAPAAEPADVAESTFRLEIDESSERSIFEQIVSGVQEGVATGRLAAGERLPSVRRLADQMDVAPGTVARAYGELERMGVVLTDGARGTRVAERPAPVPDPSRLAALDGMMRPVAVAAFHLGATAAELRAALDRAMRDILPDGGARPGGDAN